MTKIRAKSKAAPAAEAREDAEDQRAVERYLADLRAGRVRTIRSEKVMLSLGMDPFEARLKRHRPRPKYVFGAWKSASPIGRLRLFPWFCHALELPGIIGRGLTADAAKDDLIELLKLLSRHSKRRGERELCKQLVATWKTRKTRKA